jgi:hypothetical protein
VNQRLCFPDLRTLERTSNPSYWIVRAGDPDDDKFVAEISRVAAKEAATAARLAEVRDVLVPTAQLALADVVAAIVAGGGVVAGGKLEQCSDAQLKKDFGKAKNSVKQLEKEHRVLAGVGAFRSRFPAIDTLVEQVAGGAKVTKQTKSDILGDANTVGLNKYEAEDFLPAVLAAAADCKVSCTARAKKMTAWAEALAAQLRVERRGSHTACPLVTWRGFASRTNCPRGEGYP